MRGPLKDVCALPTQKAVSPLDVAALRQFAWVIVFLIAAGAILGIVVVLRGFVAEVARGLLELHRLASLASIGLVLGISCGASLAGVLVYGWRAELPFYEVAAAVGASLLVAQSVALVAPPAWSAPRERRAYAVGVMLCLGISLAACLVALARGAGSWLLLGLVSGPLVYSGWLTLVFTVVLRTPLSGSAAPSVSYAGMVEQVALSGQSCLVPWSTGEPRLLRWRRVVGPVLRGQPIPAQRCAACRER